MFAFNMAFFHSVVIYLESFFHYTMLAFDSDLANQEKVIAATSAE